jgi:hypothetical protein
MGMLIFAAWTFVLLKEPDTPFAQSSKNSIREVMMEVELLEYLDSRTDKKGKTFSCKIITPRSFQDAEITRSFQDAEITGEIIHVKAAGLQSRDAEMGLTFNKISFRDGTESNIKTSQIMHVIGFDRREIRDVKVDKIEGVGVRTPPRSLAKKIGGFFKGLIGIRGKDIKLPAHINLVINTEIEIRD